MKRAFGNDVGSVWQEYLNRKYDTNKYTGTKIRTINDVTAAIKTEAGRLMTSNIVNQFRADPESLRQNRIAVDAAAYRAMQFVSCHRASFGDGTTALVDEGSDASFIETRSRSDYSRGISTPVVEESSVTSSTLSDASEGGQWFEFNFASLLDQHDAHVSGKPPGHINFGFNGHGNTLYHAPSNLAGGTGGSDYGDDLRYFNGKLYCQMTRTSDALARPALLCRSKIELIVFDCVDMCPGQCGSELEQLLTIPFSRLEASGLAYDVPLYVEAPMPVVEVTTILESNTVEQCTDWFPNPSPPGVVSMDLVRTNVPSSEVVPLNYMHLEHQAALRSIDTHRRDANIYEATDILRELSSFLTFE